MPLYEYRCDECRAGKAVQYSIIDDYEAPQCDYCHKPMRREFSIPATIFKGTGWGKDT